MTPATLTTLKDALAVAKEEYARELDAVRAPMEPYPRPGRAGRLKEISAYLARKIEAVDRARDELEGRSGCQ